MNETVGKLILAQGYSDQDICTCENINLMIRWTPLACACLGSVGLFLQSGFFLIILGALTSIGALTNRSFYDFLYIFLIRPILNGPDIPRHGNQRRFGCGIGAILFILSGIGFATCNELLALIPVLIIIPLALIAAVTQWCFASTLYNLLFKDR